MNLRFPAPSEKQARVLWFAATSVAGAIVLALLGVVCWGVAWTVNQLASVLLPLAVAGILAYLIDPVVDWVERRAAIPRTRAILLVMFAAVVLSLSVLTSFIPTLVVEVDGLFDRITATNYATESTEPNQPARTAPEEQSAPKDAAQPENPKSETDANPDADDPAQPTILDDAKERFGAWLKTTPFGDKAAEAWESGLDNTVEEWITSSLPVVFEWFQIQIAKIASWGGLMIGMAMVPVYLFYFLLEKRGIRSNWTDYRPVRESRIKEEVVFVLKEINERLIVFFRGQVLVSMCVGVLLIIGYKLIGLPYAFLLGALAGILGIVPYLGVMLSIVPALVICIIQFGDWLHPGLLVLLFIAVQAAEGLFISPKIIGDRVGLHPLTIILAVMVGTTLLGGIIGGILAIPLTAALRTLMFRYVWTRRDLSHNGGPPGTPEALNAATD